MYKGCPLKHKGRKTKIDTVGEMIYSYRITKGLTQLNLGKAIGAYIYKETSPRILHIERGYNLPGFHNIYMLSKILGIERESFFNMVLKEHYNRFITKNHEIFFRIIEMIRNGEDISSVSTVCGYKFCVIGRIKHNFSESSAILKNAFLKKKITHKITYKKMAIEMENRANVHHCYDFRDIGKMMTGKRPPGLKILIEVCDYLEIKPFEVYKIMVKERALAHAKNMMLQWDIYKRERENGE